LQEGTYLVAEEYYINNSIYVADERPEEAEQNSKKALPVDWLYK